MKKTFRFAVILISLIATVGFMNTDPTPKKIILYNQVGYISNAPKMLLVSPHVNQVQFVNESGKTALQAIASATEYWEPAGDSVRKIDFSSITQPGKYKIFIDGEYQDTEVTIAAKPYHELSMLVMKTFYLQRSGMPLKEEYAGKWARAAGHPDTAVYIHGSAASGKRIAGTTISSPEGWYDAGDYNKYIVNSAISTYTLFRAVEDYPAYYKSLNLNIPESNGKVPDLLSEALYNFRWMMTMQDPDDGGVYHKLTNKTFDGEVMPHQASNDRYVVMKTTAASLDFAAVAAHLAFAEANGSYKVNGLGFRSLQKAEKAWAWAVANPNVIFKQPTDIKTGEYGDDKLSDEWYWAACELFLATGKQEYVDAIVKYYQQPVTPEWAIVHTLGTLSLLKSKKTIPQAILKTGYREDFFSYVQTLTDKSNNSAFGVSITKFEWGSNSSVANEGCLKLFAYQLTGNQDFLHSALADMNYLLGCNATGYCFVTGFGVQQAKRIHHRPSQADGIEAPIPGFLVGGPNLVTFADCPGDKTRDRKYPAKSYADQSCSYSTNEIAINWNAPMAYLSGALDAGKW